MSLITPLQDLDPKRFEAPNILKKLTTTSRKLAELKGNSYPEIPDNCFNENIIWAAISDAALNINF